MRTTTSIVLTLSAVACTGVNNWIEPPAWPERASVLADSSELKGRTFETAAAGPWEVRKISGRGGGRAFGGPSFSGPTTPGTASPPPGAGGGVAYRGPGDSAPRGHGGEYHGPDSSGPTTGGGGGVITASDDFFMGIGKVDKPAARAAVLRAGTTDDNEDHAAFAKFLAEQREAGLMEGRCQDLDVADRREVRVFDVDGRPVAGAEVAIFDGDRKEMLWRGTTYGDGAFPFFPSVAKTSESGTLMLEVGYGGRFLRTHWDGEGESCAVRWPAETAAPEELRIDVAFLIDTTGSMSDEIQRIKETLSSMTGKLQGLEREVDMRYGAVLYRDIGDQYVTKQHGFTQDLDAFDKALQAIKANGGGDSPESLNQGLAVAIDGLAWRDGVAKLVFLIADAPPHMDYKGDVLYGQSLQAAVARGIKIHSVAASGLDAAGTVVFRQVAHFTRGKFVFIEYGGNVQKSAEAHGIQKKVKKSNNLDDILFEQIRDEVVGWGRAAM